jgi:hypothetical protein
VLVVLAPDDVTLEMLDFPALALGDTRGLAELTMPCKMARFLLETSWLNPVNAIMEP